jgi:hypothetical protein
MAKGENASTTFSGSPETFQRDSIGTFTYSSFPAGWSDTAQVSPDSTAPQPSAVVIETTDAFGHPTNALATLPAVADSQGIYRPIESSDVYKTQADVRVDQFSDIDPAAAVEDPNNPGFLLCGCPVGTENFLDWPMQVSFAFLDGSTDPGHAAASGIIASAETHTWHLFSATANVVADIDLGVQIEEGKWYGVETDLDATNGILHGLITDKATGAILSDTMAFLNDPKYGKYDPSVDGVFNAEAYVDGEASLVHTTDPTLTKPGLAVIDNIDPSNAGNAYTYGHGYDHGGNPKLLYRISSDHGAYAGHDSHQGWASGWSSDG